VTGHQVARSGVESDVTAVGADRPDAADAVCFPAKEVRADPCRGPRLYVAHEHVQDGIGVAGYQIGRQRLERDDATVGADRWAAAEAIRVAPGGVDAHPGGRARLPVADEHVRDAVAVAGYDVAGVGAERDIAAVGADRLRASAAGPVTEAVG